MNSPTTARAVHPILTRRKFLAACGAFITGGFIADAGLFEPEWLRIGRHQVTLQPSSSNAPIRLLHLSDFHASSCVSLEFIASAIALGLSLKPDLICVTGDFISWQYETWDRYAEILSRLSACAPTFACLGNHDGGPWAAKSRNHGYANADHVRRLLETSHIDLLDNASRKVHLADRNLQLSGVSDLYNDEVQPARTLERRGDSTFQTILLCHNPDAKELLAPYHWDLMLCGHTHGGQCRIPFIGTPFAPIRDKRFVEGLHRWDERWIHVTRGVGNLHGMRFNCRPEVSLLELV